MDKVARYKKVNSVFAWLEDAGYKQRDVCARIHIAYRSYNKVAKNPYQHLTLFNLDCIYMMLSHVRKANGELKYPYADIFIAIYGVVPYAVDIKFFEEREPYLEDLMETAKCLTQPSQ